ncbi:hypothetical protein HIM_11491 [Hirsutella minnesotensis 3608]|uniref:MULE transposase domain-containing protein n=1 Tax=Hirsutella minnesotensis 3608 TaxID=1043627 RepID=A0A0F7ZR75_9HYPO|nr:hypothetical protein HIM_11491 [Hirsutella minnesotensis 3608]
MDLQLILNNATGEAEAEENPHAAQQDPDSQAGGKAIPLLPPSPQFDTFTDLYDFLQTWHRDNGAAIVKACSSKKKTVNGVEQHTTPAQLELEKNLSKHKALPARELGSIVRDTTPGESFFRQRDIYNDRQKLRIAALGGKTATQAFIDHLQRGRLKHTIKFADDDENKVEAVFWTYPWCEKMWKRFPEVLGLDNTYKTNRFKMYFFQVTGVTDQRTVANFAFGLINTEKEQGFSWLCERLDKLRREVEAPAPTVVITDKETALKKALLRVFPLAQQQLCVFHVNANVNAKIKSRWRSDEADDSLTDTDEAANEPAAEPNANEATETAPAASEVAYTREGMFKAWQRVVYAASEEDFESAWQLLDQTFGQHQGHIVKYISSEYMPWREQWARCYICRYRNFGQRVNSPVETAHKDIKSYLLTGTGDLLHLHNALLQMIENKDRHYVTEAARQQMRQRQEYLGQQWLGRLNVEISYYGIELLARQHCWATAAMPSASRAAVPLRACTGQFTQQYGLPCAHTILQRLEADSVLAKEDVHPRWWLEKPLDLEEPLLRIRDPDVVENLRGRPRLPRNEKIVVPSSLQHKEPQHQESGHDAPEATQAAASQQPQGSQRGSLPRSSQQSSRRLNASVRRTRTRDELDELGAAASSQGTSQPSTKRSRTSNNTAKTRARGSTGRRGRGGRAGADSSQVEEVIPATQASQASQAERAG